MDWVAYSGPFFDYNNTEPIVKGPINGGAE